MAFKDIFKISRKTFFNPAGWLDYEALKQQNVTIYTTIKSLFDYETPKRQETFEEAMKRLNISEADVIAMCKSYRVYSLFFLLLGLLMFVYAFYLLFGPHSITGWLLALGVSGLFLGQAFRYDFWVLQMRRRKLGLTFDDWTRHILGGK